MTTATIPKLLTAADLLALLQYQGLLNQTT